MCKLVVKQNGMMLQHIRKDLLTEEISKLEVQQNRTNVGIPLMMSQ